MRARPTLLVCALLVGLALPLPTSTEAANEPPAASAAGAPPAAIPVAEVARQAAETASTLRGLTTRLAPAPEIAVIERELPELRLRIDRELAATESILRTQPTLDALQSQQQVWQRRQLQTTAWLTALTQRATLLQDTLTHLAGLRATWRLTRDATETAGAPGPMRAQIQSTLAAIQAAEAPLVADRTAILALQGAVAQEIARCGTAVAQLTQAQQHAMGGILTRDGPPIWASSAWEEMRTTLPVRIREVAAGGLADIAAYARHPGGGPLYVGIFALLALALSAVRRQLRPGDHPATERSPATAVWDRPYAATVVIALLVVSAPTSGVPLPVRRLFGVLALGGVIRVAQPVVDPRLAPGLYALWGLFVVDTLRLPVAGVPLVEQTLLALEMLAGLAVLGLALRRRGSRPGPEAITLPAVRAAVVLVTLGFAIALVAGATGYMRLARLLASGLLGSAALALMLYAARRVLVGLAAFAFRVWPLRLLHMVRQHRDLLERRVGLVTAWAAAVGWVLRTLDYVGLFQPARAFWEAMVATELGRGSIRISVGIILEFVATRAGRLSGPSWPGRCTRPCARPGCRSPSPSARYACCAVRRPAGLGRRSPVENQALGSAFSPLPAGPLPWSTHATSRV